MKRGEIYRSREKTPERGNKPGFYVVVSRTFIASSPDISTVICAPVYSQILGIRTEVEIGPESGLPRDSAIRCDFLMLQFKHKLTHFVGSLSPRHLDELDAALAIALDLVVEHSH